MKQSGAQVIEYDGTTPRGFLDALNEANAFFVDGTQQDAKGGDTRAAEGGGDAPGPETEVPETPVSEPAPQAQEQGGPRIVINPSTFRNQKDALCVAFNEGFRLWMEANDFQPRSEPTDRQRRFFSDTAYADDELQLRRTILARIATFDTSVKDPTDDQLTETAQFLDGVLESGWCRNEWEQDSVSRLSQAVKAAIGAEPVEPREEPLEPAQAEPLEPAGGEEVQALQSGGSTDDEEEDRFALQNSGQSDKVGPAEDADLASREAVQAEGAGMQPEAQEQAQEPAADQGAATVQAPAADAPQAGEPAKSNEPTDEQVRQAEAQNEKDLAAVREEYGRMEKSGKLDQPGAQSNENSDKPRLTLASPVDPDSPGSISYRGTRPGGIESPIVSPDSPGSISGPILSYAPGSIESPVDDPRRKEERRKRRDRRRRGLL